MSQFSDTLWTLPLQKTTKALMAFIKRLQIVIGQDSKYGTKSCFFLSFSPCNKKQRCKKWQQKAIEGQAFKTKIKRERRINEEISLSFCSNLKLHGFCSQNAIFRTNWLVLEWILTCFDHICQSSWRLWIQLDR